MGCSEDPHLADDDSPAAEKWTMPDLSYYYAIGLEANSGQHKKFHLQMKSDLIILPH